MASQPKAAEVALRSQAARLLLDPNDWAFYAWTLKFRHVARGFSMISCKPKVSCVGIELSLKGMQGLASTSQSILVYTSVPSRMGTA